MSFFPTTEWLPPMDPILGLLQEYRADVRQNKVNLAVGAYRTADGDPYVLSSVRTAEKMMSEAQLNKEYRPIDGEQSYRDAIAQLVLGQERFSQHKSCLYVAAAVGGTGALRLGGEYLALKGERPIYLPNPTWANHKSIFDQAGLATDSYPYLDPATGLLDFPKMCAAFEAMPEGSIVLLHACCHNPSGVNPTDEQWQQIAEIFIRRSLLPFFDMAYQGFGKGLNEDAFAVRVFVDRGIELMLAYSCSKNFGLYGERVGALMLVSKDSSAVEPVSRQVKFLARANFSNPPCHGGGIVTTILDDEALTQEWQKELTNMCQRVQEMRKSLVSGLLAAGYEGELKGLSQHQGLFSYGFLNREHVDCLRHDYAVYVPSSGRINVAGLTQNNLPYVIEAILGAVKYVSSSD